MKDNGFKLTKERSRRYTAQTITDVDYADDIVLLVSKPAQAETRLHSLEPAAAGIGRHVNAHKTEYMCVNQKGDICSQNGCFLILMDMFNYLESNVSSTKNDINTQLAKLWTGIDRISVIWKSELSDTIKRSFIQAVVVSILLYRCTTLAQTKRPKGGRQAKTYKQQLCADTGCCLEDLLEEMDDREVWQEKVREISADDATWYI